MASSYHEIDTIKIEKEKAMRRYRFFEKIANIVRALEVIVAITFISYSITFSSNYFPTFIDFSGVFLRRISSLLFSPHFVFLVGNVIIITLFAKSSSEKSAGTSVDEIFGDKISAENVGDEDLSSDDNVTEFSGEKIACDDNVTVISGEKNECDDNVTEISGDIENLEVITAAEEDTGDVENLEVVTAAEEEKVYRRTKSAVEKAVVKAEKKELRRSATEVRRKVENPEETPAMTRRRFEVDDLSNEEFQRKVEAFIEKQQRFLRKEQLAVVLR